MTPTVKTDLKYTNAADAVLKMLGGRKGFDWWWHDIDEDTKEEIRDVIAKTIAKKLKP